MLAVFRSALSAAAVAGLMLAQPAMATRSAQSLPAAGVKIGSVEGQGRIGSKVGESEDLRGGFIIPLIAIVAIILGILAATSGGDDDLPHSP